MSIKRLMREQKLSVMDISKKSGIPYSTVRELICGKKDFRKCSVDTFRKIADVFNLTMDQLFREWDSVSALEFELFKSNACHKLKSLGDLEFLQVMLTEDEITRRWQSHERLYAFYLLAMLDQVSKENKIPLYGVYDPIRQQKMEKMIYPMSAVLKNQDTESSLYFKNANPEFLKYNIVEGDIRDVF